MQVEIKFKRTGAHSVYGNFAAGDIIRCDKELADFYVRDGVARYTEALAQEVEEAAPQPVADKAKRGRKAAKE